jgi:hypothetical protein
MLIYIYMCEMMSDRMVWNKLHVMMQTVAQRDSGTYEGCAERGWDIDRSPGPEKDCRMR